MANRVANASIFVPFYPSRKGLRGSSPLPGIAECGLGAELFQR